MSIKKFIPRFLSPLLLRTEFRRLRRLCPAKQTTVINMPREINIKNTPARNASTFKLPVKKKTKKKGKNNNHKIMCIRNIQIKIKL